MRKDLLCGTCAVPGGAGMRLRSALLGAGLGGLVSTLSFVATLCYRALGAATLRLRRVDD